MAWFTAKEWKNRLVEFAGRRSLKNVTTSETTLYDVTRSEGHVSQEGDAFSAATMNDLEQRISEGFSAAEEANSQLSSEISSMKQSFQDGVNTIYNKIVSCGVTPYNKTPTECAKAIQTIYDGRYSSGYSIGYNEGRTQGQNDVKGNPNNYGLYSKSQYDQNYNNGYNAGFSAGEAAASYSVENISSKLSAYASQNHGFRSSVSLSGYKYIIVCAIYQSGKTANFSSFSGCKCLAQTSWTAYGASTSIAVSAHLIILSDITGAVDVSASSTGTGNVSVRAFGFK